MEDIILNKILYDKNKQLYIALKQNNEDNLLGGASGIKRSLDRSKLIAKKIYDAIKSFIFDKNALPLYDFKTLPSTLPYLETRASGIKNANCHLGQRKLL